MQPRNHDFVLIDGIEIDKGMEWLIRSLWSKGIITSACCEHLNSNFSWERPVAHIIFPYTAEAMYFTEVTCRALWNDYGNPDPSREDSMAWAQSNFSMNPMLTLGGPTLRWSVKWDIGFTERITEFWMDEVGLSK